MNVLKVPKILLPAKKVNKEKWSVVACDQFTSQLEYWKELEKHIAGEPSTLELTFPEVYLQSKGDCYKDVINKNMKRYLDEGIFEEYEGLIFVKRTLSGGGERLGLMLLVDLEQYDYTQNNNALIKATEKTVVERLPIRIKIRENAPLEIPHIMLLMDDQNSGILEDLAKNCNKEKKLYDTPLNMRGGRLEGYSVSNPDKVLDKISALACGGKMLFAVGDGNHSLATAKECWNKIKKDLSVSAKAGCGNIVNNMLDSHPARYALCELVSLHDKSLKFEAIHRVVRGVGKEFITLMQSKLSGNGKIKIVYFGSEYTINVSSNPSDAIADIQNFIDEYIVKTKGAEIDYIHGDDNLLEVAKRDNAVAVFMPVIEKGTLFSYVERRGVLPRKSFSMGHAEDKRYYFEARKITI